MAQVIGFDGGNSEATLAAALSPQMRLPLVTMPSFVGAGSLDELRRMRSAAGDEGWMRPGEFVIELDGRSVYVGDLALSQAREQTSARGDISRYWSGHTRWLLLAALSQALSSGDEPIRIVTGLPIEVWRRENVRRVVAALVGDHRFKVNGRARRFLVEGVLVVMEGAGALALHGVTDEVPQYVADMGGRTLNLYAAKGQAPLLPRCKGAPIGVGLVGDLIAETFARRYGRALSQDEVRAILRAHARGQPQPPLFVEGQPVVLNGEVRAAIATIGSDATTLVSSVWRSGEQGKVASEAARVLFVGGGSYFFAEAMRELIPQLIIPAEPEHANARGYLAMGQALPEGVWQRLQVT